jgi:hypothetical protein
MRAAARAIALSAGPATIRPSPLRSPRSRRGEGHSDRPAPEITRYQRRGVTVGDCCSVVCARRRRPLLGPSERRSGPTTGRERSDCSLPSASETPDGSSGVRLAPAPVLLAQSIRPVAPVKRAALERTQQSEPVGTSSQQASAFSNSNQSSWLRPVALLLPTSRVAGTSGRFPGSSGCRTGSPGPRPGRTRARTLPAAGRASGPHRCSSPGWTSGLGRA